MALYDPARQPDVDPADAVAVVHRFLEQVRAWALTREIPRRTATVSADLDPVEAGKLHAWIAYLRFTEHALKELEDGTLDGWFGPQPPPAVDPGAGAGTGAGIGPRR